MKKKLKLDEIKVKSFVTGLKGAEHIKGGGDLPTDHCFTGIYPTIPVTACAKTQTNGYNCPTEMAACTAIGTN